MEKNINNPESIGKVKNLSKNIKNKGPLHAIKKTVAVALASAGLGAIVTSASLSHNYREDMSMIELEYDSEINKLKKELEAANKDNKYLMDLVDAYSQLNLDLSKEIEELKNPTSEIAPTPVEVEKPEYSFDLPLIKYTVKPNDNISTIVTNQYYSIIGSALAEKANDDYVQTNTYYLTRYLVATTSNINKRAGLIQNSDSLGIGDVIYLVDPSCIDSKTVFTVCACGPKVLDIDKENDVATIEPTNPTERISRVTGEYEQNPYETINGISK